MRVLADTGVLLRLIDSDDASHQSVVDAIDKLLRRESVVFLTPQGCREFWNVATRPRSANGLGLEPAVVDHLLNELQAYLGMFDDAAGIFAQWRIMASSLPVRGIQVHDANHAAAAIYHGATHILTLNKKDFERYSGYGLRPLLPGEV